MIDILPPLKIIYATSWFGLEKFSNDLKYNSRDCPIPKGYKIVDENVWCTLTSSTENMEEATGLIFHAPDVSSYYTLNHTLNQPWILESLESPYSSLFRSLPEKMKDYNYLASYNLNSAFLFSYFSSDIMNVVNRVLPEGFIDSKSKSAPILWIARNCYATSGRQHYIEELMKYVKVDSYGPCLNNNPFPSNKDRMQLLGEYKFYLSMENANCEDYVTEKLYDTFMMSSVPIVDGPKSYKGFIPSDRSVIYADAYPDPKDLADYINYLDQNDTAYLEYLTYRRDAIELSARKRFDPEFLDQWSDPDKHNKRSSYCSICRGLLPWWSHRLTPSTASKPYKDPKNYFLVDETCAEPGKWNYISKGRPYNQSWVARQPDEFTRPSPAVIDTILEHHINQVKDHHTINRSVALGHLASVWLFLLFVGFLIRRLRKTRGVHEPAPV